MDFKSALHRLIDGRHVSLLERARLECTIYNSTSSSQPSSSLTATNAPDTTATTFQALNEVVFHRGHDPHLAVIDCVVDKE